MLGNYLWQKLLFLIIIMALILGACNEDITKQSTAFETWQDYLGDSKRTHFSTLNQIDTSNVASLKLAWHYKSGGLVKNRRTQIQTNPLIVDTILYGVNPAIELFALNAATGKEVWKFSPTIKDNSGLGVNRGLVYWSSEDETDQRIFFSMGSKLYAVNASTGEVSF